MLKNVFTNIYNKNLFGGRCKSGFGSDPEHTEQITKELPKFINAYGIKTIIDAPCGEVQYMSEVLDQLNNYEYIGIDIVDDLINKNSEVFKFNKRMSWACRNIVESELPIGDFLICRDCLVHLDNTNTKLVAAKFKNYKYVASTNFPGLETNNGNWKPINLIIEPYNFGKPYEVIFDDDFVEGIGEKTLSIWQFR
jgi:hypothetical protein